MTGIVVVGGGLAAARVVEAYREAGGGDPVAVVGGEPVPPYSRPPLSKGLLRGATTRDDAILHPAGWYEEQGADLRLGTRAERIDPDAREVVLEGGERLSYDRLVVATGAVPRRFPVPGAELEGIRSFRTLADAEAVRDAAAEGGRALVVGAGFIGMEVAASLRLRGLEVTVVELGERVMPALASDELSASLAGLYRERGVELLLGESVEAFLGDGALHGARLASGRDVEAMLAVVGVGVAPATGIVEGTGVEVDDGIVVDESFRTSVPGIYAVGDVARFPDRVAGRARRIEHWTNADAQGRALGRMLAGDETPYEHLAVFFTMLFDTKLQVVGDLEGGVDEALVEGDLREGRVLARYGRGGRLVGVTVAGQPDEVVEEARRQIREGVALAELTRASSR